MIIFGTKGRSIKMDSGEFHCPNCNDNRVYNKKYVQDWFTLYFIPTFPVGGKKNEHIECEECSSIYHLDVIDYKPGLNDEEMTSEYEKALQNVLCLMIIADDNKYLFVNISGVIFTDNIDECIDKQNEIKKELALIFPNAITTNRDKVFNDVYWKGTRNIQFSFFLENDGGSASVHCYDYSEEHGGQDHLSVNFKTTKFNDFLLNEAYE